MHKPIIIPTARFWFGGEAAEFDFTLEVFQGGDGLITIHHGETAEEAAPIPVHAIYLSTVTEDVPYIAHRFLEEWTESLDADLTMAEFEEVLADTLRSEYDRRVAAGMGDWVRGDSLITRGTPQGPAHFNVIAASEGEPAWSYPQADAYERSDPKHPNYLDAVE